MSDISIPSVPGRRGGARPGAGRPRKDRDAPPPPAGHVSYAEARRRKELALARIREDEQRKLAGRLLERAAVERELTAIGAEVWANLERLADTLPMQLAAAADAHAIAEILEVELRRIATELADQIKTVLRPAGGPNEQP